MRGWLILIVIVAVVLYVLYQKRKVDRLNREREWLNEQIACVSCGNVMSRQVFLKRGCPRCGSDLHRPIDRQSLKGP